MKKMLLAEIWTIAQTNHGCVVFLRPENMDLAVPIIIGKLELQSILIGREGIVLPRPLTHDLVLDVFQSLKITLRQVEIHSLINDTFHARLILDTEKFQSSRPLPIDCRPSDAIALAVREKCPIYLTASIVEKTGIPLEFLMEDIEKTASSPDKDEESGNCARYNELIGQLNQAVEAEEYERAAEIRDLLFQLKNSADNDIIGKYNNFSRELGENKG